MFRSRAVSQNRSLAHDGSMDWTMDHRGHAIGWHAVVDEVIVAGGDSRYGDSLRIDALYLIAVQVVVAKVIVGQSAQRNKSEPFRADSEIKADSNRAAMKSQ